MLTALRLGQSGDGVRQWQLFLTGQGYDAGETDGSFGPKTFEATKRFQADVSLIPDGIVGRASLGHAISRGYGKVDDLEGDEASSTWPPLPNLAPLSWPARFQIFGTFAYKPNPVPGNPEAIAITDGWAARNIVQVDIPQLKRKVPFHVKAAPQLQSLFAAWEAADLTSLILSWDGSWVPRFVRGSRTYLSNHSFGTAFDVNATWNALGTQPALVGQRGSVRKLVALANTHGFFWGGHWGYSSHGRADGMHFEVACLR